MTLGSLFDGIGGWLLAARHAGVTPLWASDCKACLTATPTAGAIRHVIRRSETVWRSRAPTM